jgi:hypothetical protein
MKHRSPFLTYLYRPTNIEYLRSLSDSSWLYYQIIKIWLFYFLEYFKK